jgi:hypothetical protein
MTNRLRFESLEPRVVLTTFNVADFGSIQAAVDAAAANPGDDIVQIPAGAYSENVSISDASGALSLVGLGGTASDVVIDGGGNTAIDAILQNDVSFRGLRITNGLDGIFASGSGNVSLRNVELTGNVSDGLDINGAGDVHLTNVVARNNGNDGVEIRDAADVEVDHLQAVDNFFEGLDIDFAGDVSTSHVNASSNDRNGLNLFGIQSWTDHQGSYRDNANFGVVARDIAGDVALTGTRAEDNNANGNLSGDGVRFGDGNDADSFSIGGSLTIVNGAFDNNRIGLYSVHTIGGDVTITNVSVSNNELAGVRFRDGRPPRDMSIVGNLTITNVQLNNNGSDGLFVQHPAAGDVTLVNVNATDNGGRGVSIAGAASVFIRGGQYNRNALQGINIQDATFAVLLGVKAQDNGLFDLQVVSSGLPTINGQSIGSILIVP